MFSARVAFDSIVVRFIFLSLAIGQANCSGRSSQSSACTHDCAEDGGTQTVDGAAIPDALGPSCSSITMPNPASECQSDLDCGCPLRCVSDPILGSVCARPCADTNGCI